MLVITVDFRIHREYVEAFRRLVCENARASLAEEPGCRQFDVCTDPEQPDAIFLYEVYDDRAAFETHLHSRHFGRFDAAIKEMVAVKHVSAFERIEPA